ncbi:hypothetical protein AYJ57_02400 [Salipiger sp. CCB-MM3]|uniref:DUF6902 family protein n=1 Tax=Salipiger sp. CCB-MM3 TaxID=1792508 RepID=UPI00080AC09A|nr:hypothetical protein [Salipiger sp. CCB-MM3]ANT59312.1 hypothetical protein AYJ57_02400 [Salipiger sp. CCB-MM3]
MTVHAPLSTSGNVIAFPARQAALSATEGAASLLQCFARHRRREEDVFWLKENAELLNILECTGAEVAPQALEVLETFYTGAEARLAFFPQYYRFLLSIVLDLEDLGMPGESGARMAQSIADHDLPDAELSDLQRMEARRLLARRDITCAGADAGLEDRLRDFCARSRGFALPNKKAAYELTHVVFYLSEYGRRDPQLPVEALTSLQFAGNLAYLEQNSDLLSEICIALRYAGQVPPALWTLWLARQLRGFALEEGPQLSLQDDYHDFLVCNWQAAVAGGAAFEIPAGAGRRQFLRGTQQGAPLRELSQALYGLGAQRCADWQVMRRRMNGALSPQVLGLLDTMAEGSEHFDAFFEGFARAGQR